MANTINNKQYDGRLKKMLLKTQELIDASQWNRAIYALELVNIRSEDISKHSIVEVYDGGSYGDFTDNYEGPWWFEPADNRIYRGRQGEKTHEYYFDFINDTEWLEAHWCIKNAHGDFTFTVVLEYSALDGVRISYDIQDNSTMKSTGWVSTTIEWLIKDFRFEDIQKDTRFEDM